MSLKNVKNEEKNRVALEIVIPKPDFDAAVSKVFAKKAKSIVVNGFRKGKAPRSVIEKIYGKGIFYEDALNDLLPAVLKSAVEESKVQIVSSPELEVGDINDEGVQITAKYYVKPEVTVKKYKGLKAEKTVRTASDDEVESEIERVRERNARTVDVKDRPVKDGDIADIDYEGSVDGKVFEGGSAKGHKLTIGSHSFIPGFEDQIISHSVGDEFDVNVTFPEDYHAEELKGKPAVFKVKLNGIEYRELPELDDEFAKDVSEFDTLDEYKADVRAKINDRYSASADREVEDKLVEALLENTEADVPQCMFDEESDAVVRNYESNMAQQGISMEMYLKYTGMTLEKMKEQVMPQAQRQVRTRLALEKIAALENLEASPEDIDKEIASIAASYGMKPEEVKGMVVEDMVVSDVKNKKALDLIKDNAVIAEKPYEAPKPEAASEKKPAKKPAAKKSAAQKSDAQKPAAQKPAAKKPAAKKPKTAAPAEDKPEKDKTAE